MELTINDRDLMSPYPTETHDGHGYEDSLIFDSIYEGETLYFVRFRTRMPVMDYYNDMKVFHEGEGRGGDSYSTYGMSFVECIEWAKDNCRFW